jgi:K+-sensing histidine kinase KdpD
MQLTVHDEVAHGLRTPLTSVLGFSSTLLEQWETLDDRQRLQIVQIVYGEALRMAHSVEFLDRTLYSEIAGRETRSTAVKIPA